LANEILGTDVVVQIGIIVKDIEKTAKDFAKFLELRFPRLSKPKSMRKLTQSIEERLHVPVQNLRFSETSKT